MSWTNFTIYLVVAYLFYYALNLIIDLTLCGKENEPGSDASTSSVHYQVENLDQPIELPQLGRQESTQSAPPGLLSSGETGSSGAQRFEQIMQAASQQLIECSKRML